MRGAFADSPPRSYEGCTESRPQAALAAWRHADLAGAPTFLIDGFRQFHKLFGRHHGDVVFRDATRAGPKTF